MPKRPLSSEGEVQTSQRRQADDPGKSGAGGDVSTPLGSRVIKFRDSFHWAGLARRLYKDDTTAWQGVSRTSLVGGTLEPRPEDERPAQSDEDGARAGSDAGETAPAGPNPPFHVRYFEVEPGGYTSREKHAHQHVVVVLRGKGSVELGGQSAPLSFGDAVYVAPWEVHQFKSERGTESFGFLCIVPAERDRPIPVEHGGDSPTPDVTA